MHSPKEVKIKGNPYRLLFSREEIIRKVNELAQQIANDHKGIPEPPLLLFVLTGGLYLGIDLSRALDSIGLRHSVDTIGLKRYDGDEQGGLVQIISWPHANLGNRDLIIIEDVIDYGKTMNFLHKYLLKLDTPPRTINYCTLLLKENHDPLVFSIKYLGWTISPEWIVGNGMDSEQHYRGLLDIYVKKC